MRLFTFLNLSRIATHHPCLVKFCLPQTKTWEKNANQKLKFHQRIVTKYNIPKRNIPKFINIKSLKQITMFCQNSSQSVSSKSIVQKLPSKWTTLPNLTKLAFFSFLSLFFFFFFFFERFCLCKYSSYYKDTLELPELLFESNLLLWFWKFSFTSSTMSPTFFQQIQEVLIQHFVPFTHAVSYWTIDTLCW